ncbi:MAG: hypothetical protein H6983_26425 [Ectothiorhodospiraceae bacterium]|nr:hypothetical protein [Ectothiorhodospiraceae bacterium]
MNRRLEAAIRTIAALPADDWQPEHWGAFEAARHQLVLEVGRIDRAHEQSRSDRQRRTEGWWTLAEARKVVKERSGGMCELQGPTCQGKAREVDHVYGRRGPNPHDPAKLLHVCGHGNLNGCHGLVSSSREWRERSRVLAAELEAKRQGEAS